MTTETTPTPEQQRVLGSALVQILAVRHEDRKTKDGREYTLHEAEAILFNPDGSIRVPKHLASIVSPGKFNFGFGFARSFNSGYFDVVVTAITPVEASPSKPAKVS